MSAREVVLDGGSPWGFRIHGGCDVGMPLKISRVNPGSKAALKGIREGDIISSINQTPTKNLDNSTAHCLLRNAGQHLRLGLNEDGGVASPRRRIKQTITTTVFTEQKAPSGEVTSRSIEVKKEENGEEKAKTEKVKAQVHAEQIKTIKSITSTTTTTSSSTKENGANVIELENEKSKFLKQNETTLQKEETTASDASSEKQEKQGCLLSLDKKLKLQIKKQKKKEKKLEFEANKSKIVEETSAVAEIQGKYSQVVQGIEKSDVTFIDNVPPEKKDEVFKSSSVVMPTAENSESGSDNTNTSNVCEYLSTVEKNKDKIESNNILKSCHDFKTIENKPSIETIPEDLFEEFIENEEIVQTKEAIRTFPKTSPICSPTTRKKNLPLTEIRVITPPKVFYNYHGVSYRESLSKPIIVENIEDEVKLCNYKFKEDELFSNRKLDVIMEESSDLSDISGNSEKKSHVAILKKHVSENNTLIQPLLKKTVKIYSLNQESNIDNKSNDVLLNGTYIVRPEIANTMKMSNDVVKVDLAESESEGDYEIIQSETSEGTGEIEVICFEKSDAFSTKLEDNLERVGEAMDCSDASSWSIKSITSNLNSKVEEGSESWKSSLNLETGNSAEADIESDLESQKTCVFGEFDEELNFKKYGIKNNEIELIKTDYTNLSQIDSSNLCSGSKPFEFALQENKDKSKNKVNGFVEGFQEANALNDENEYNKINVKKLADAMKGDMDKILMSKLKLIQHCDEPELRENSLKNLLEGTKIETGNKNIKYNNVKVKEISSSSSYEYVVKPEKKITMIETFPENFKNPDALSNLAEKKVLTLPYGKLILKKIGLGSCCSNDCSKGTEEDMYLKSDYQHSEVPTSVSPVPSQVSIRSLRGSVSNRSRNFEDDQISESDRSYIEFDYSNPKFGDTEKWYGSRTDVPAVFLGFSPSQRKIYEEINKKAMPDEIEAATLLDLHQKFLERRSYNETVLHGKNRNLIFNSKNKNIQAKPIVITEITPGSSIEYLKRQSATMPEKNKNENKEIKIVKDDVHSTNQFISLTKNQELRSGKNKNLEVVNDLIKPKIYDEGSQIENHHDEESKKKRETEKNEQEAEVVGNSCLLAILQNAISDEFVPELKTDSSIKCSGESHEVSLLTNPQTMSEAWKFYETSKSLIKEKQGNKQKNESEKDRQTFEQIWNKEKGITMGERKIGALNLENGINRQLLRPKSVCLEKKENNGKNETETEKKINPNNNLKSEANENLVITENLPSVSDVIRSFEEPQLKEPINSLNGQANAKIQMHWDNEKYEISKQGDIAFISNGVTEKKKLQKEKRKSLPISILTDQEIFKQKMYDEYMSKLAERIERRQQKTIRVSQSNEIECPEEIRFFDLENEFINKVKERREKLNLAHDKKEADKAFMESLQKQCQEFSDYWKEEISNLENSKKEEYNIDKSKDGGTESSATSKRSSVQLIFDTSSNVENLPKHLQEFLMVDQEEFPDFYDDFQRIKAKVQECGRCKLRKNNLLREIDEELVLSKGFLFGRGKFYNDMPSSVMFSPNFKATAPRPGVWSPAQGVQVQKTEIKKENEERKKLEDEPIPPVWTPKASPVLEKKEFRPINFESPTLPRKKYIQDDKRESSVPPPWQQPGGEKLPELAKSPSSPALILPKAPNPTVTLLQKAREGHLPRGAHYLNSDMNDSPAFDGTSIEKLEIVSTIKNDRSQKIESAPKKIIGIGPTTKEGIPLVLRSEVTEENKEKWYKRMYDSLHKAGQDDDYVTVKYRTSPSRKGIYNYQQSSRSGYLSEPESINYDISTNKYVSLDRRRIEKSKEDDYACITLPRSRSSPPRRDFTGYKNQPGRIEDYEPGRSSISETETNKWWDEVLEIFDKWLEYNPEAPDPAYNKLLIDAIKLRREEGRSKSVQKTPVSPRSFTNFASGYISDPQYVYKRRDEEIQSPNSEEQKEAYRIIQKGGEIPLKGLRKPAPTRPKDSLETEIEYFPLSPTLTRIRVHKQNITPLSEYPFYKSPTFGQSALNYPTIPFGVCSSFSQVQIFPPPFTQFLTESKKQEPILVQNQNLESNFLKKPQKFSVQLQNISGPDDYFQIIPKPRCRTKKSPIYANILTEEEDLSNNIDTPIPVIRKDSKPPKKENIELNQNNIQSTSNFTPEKKVGFATFSDLKRIAPSLISTSTSKVSLSKILNKTDQGKIPVASEKKGSLISHFTSKSSSQKKRRNSKEENKENQENIIKNKDLVDKVKKKERKKSLLTKPKNSKIVRAVKKTGKVPLSESKQREKPLSKTNKSFKTLSNTLKKKKDGSEKLFIEFDDKVESKNKRLETDKKKDIIEYISRFVDSEIDSTYIDLKSSEDLKSQVCFDIIEEKEEEEEEEKEKEASDLTMSPIYESLDENSKTKGDIDVTEAFRSRSFSPDVRRKIYKLPDMNKPIPPKRKQSKNNPTLKMWSKMMVSYPSRKSHSEECNSNVKFLQEKIKRKLKDDKDSKLEFGDDIETVRTVKRNKNGSMSIKTDRYVRLSSPDIIKTRSTYPDIERRKKLFEPKAKFRSLSDLNVRKYSDASTITKSSDPENNKKISNTYVKSSTTYSVQKSKNEEDNKRKSLKVTVAISSKDKELVKKTSDSTTSKKNLNISKISSSPCPSITSSKSSRSVKSPLSDKGSLSYPKSPQTKFFSPNSSASHLSGLSRSASPGSSISKQTKSKLNVKSLETSKSYSKTKEKDKIPLPQKTFAKKLPKFNITKNGSNKNELKKKSKKNDYLEEENKKGLKKIGNVKIKSVLPKTPEDLQSMKKVQKEKNEVVRGRDLVRTDSFFQNLFLRGPIDLRPTIEVERSTSVLERARRYQKRIDWPETYKSEPSLSLLTFYLHQKRPVSLSRFRNLERDFSSLRLHSPLGSWHSENFQMKLKRFDSMSQFEDGFCRDYSPEGKERSSSEPPLNRSNINSPDMFEGKPRISTSEVSSMRSSPNSSRSPSCRRIRNYKTSAKTSDSNRDIIKMESRARSAGEIEELKSKSNLHYGNLGKSSSSLNLSNLSDHTEYQAYVLELMHSTRKCERFRELHKFYSNLERMEKLEKTASTGDLRPRLRNEEIIDFDRWKKIRTKERAEAELKTLVDNLVKVQKEKDLLFRTTDIQTVRWKGDRGLRIKERSVEDLKGQFDKVSQEEIEFKKWKNDLELKKDNYKSLWKGNSIIDVAGALNNPVISHRGRPITLEEFQKIADTNAKIGKEYGYSLKAWKNLSNEQLNLFKEQLSEIYNQEARKKSSYENLSESPCKYEILVPKDGEIKSLGESSLQVRCNSAMSKSQTFTPTIKRKENLLKELKKSESVNVLPSVDLGGSQKTSFYPLSWKEEIPASKIRSHSESRSSRSDYSIEPRSKSASSKPLTENEKKQLSMTLSKEVIEKMTKSSGQGPLFPRETLGALAIAGSDLRELPKSQSKDGSEFFLHSQQKSKNFEKFASEKSGKPEAVKFSKLAKVIPASSMELESGSGSSDTSIKTVIRRDSVDVFKRVQYFEELQQATEQRFEADLTKASQNETQVSIESNACNFKESSKTGYKLEKPFKPKRGGKKNSFISSSSLENLNDYFGQQKQYTTSSLYNNQSYKILPSTETSKSYIQLSPKEEEFYYPRNYYDDRKWIPRSHHSISPLGLRGSSNDSLFSYRSRSVSPDPTKYYRAYLRMVKCGAVRKLCNKFESWEDILSLSSDKDFWLPPAPRRFASDPELTRDLLKRFGTDPTKVTVRGQEVGDVRWLRTKFEKDMSNTRGRSRFRRTRSPLLKSPITASDRYMPRINVISKKAELQLQGLNQTKIKDLTPSNLHDLAGSPEEYKTLIDYTKDHGGYYYTGEVEKLRRKFERLQEAERLSILGQMYTSTPDVNELRDIAPYLECSWVAHRYPRAFGSPEYRTKLKEPPKKIQSKPRPHSSSPIRTRQLSSILKQPHPPHPSTDRNIFADQKYDPLIHRPKYRYQPEHEVERRSKRGDPDWWRHWNKPTVKFKDIDNFDFLSTSHEKSPDSPRKYVESEVTIHYKSPVRSEAKVMLSEDELARRQAESMKRIYKEERRRKYLQELQDMNSRRHTDNFTPSQKSPIPLNRYDDFPFNDSSLYTAKSRDYTTDTILVARGLYDFVGRRPRELAFRRGDIIFIIKRLDKNWCEGELNGAVGLFPLSYVEVIPYNEINMKFGRARAKYDFVPQTSLELAAHKGEMITLIRKIDENWFEGRIGDKTGIIPASYCHILAMPQPGRIPIRTEKVNKPVAVPAAHSLVHNGSGLSSKHFYAPHLSGPSSPGRSTISSASANYHDGQISPEMLIDEALMQLDEEFDLKRSTAPSASQPLNVRINPRPEPALYQVMFNHVPNNDDELELVQGETVSVIEKCGDGWYIGSKTSDGKLGIFPGTHVRRIAPEFV